MNGLLASLVASRGWDPEPVATESLVHLLHRPEARSALGKWADNLVPGLAAEDLEYADQVVDGDSEGRPDVVGSTGAVARVVIEAKFAAPLTSAQSAGAYIGHLTGDEPGLLVYLVPSDRVSAMWSAALQIHAGATVVAGPGQRRLITSEGHVVTVLEWTKLLDFLASELLNTPAAGDLAQLRGLVEWRCATQWVPILPDDLNDRVGRQIAGLSRMVLRAAKDVPPSRSTSAISSWGLGRYLTSPQGRKFWVGIWYRLWGDLGHSPVWVSVKPTITTHEALRARLNTTSRPAFVHGDWVAVPLYLVTGEEEESAKERLMADIAKFADELDAVGVATTAPRPADTDL